jgi:aryl-alcohol dehydrogenase-like predicted oxidoreductase
VILVNVGERIEARRTLAARRLSIARHLTQGSILRHSNHDDWLEPTFWQVFGWRAIFRLMKYRRLGRTGFEVSEIGYGAWGIGKQMWQGAADQESLAALHSAADFGVNFIDTALAYGDGHSEQLIGRFLKERRDRIYVATKVPPKNRIWPAHGTLEEVYPYDYILSSADTSLRNLQLDSVDILQLHVWDPEWLHLRGWHEALCRLKEEGKVRFLGISVNDHQSDSALTIVESGKIDTIQVIYNIFDQTAADRLFPLCDRTDTGVIARVPFDEGALTGGITPETVFPEKDWRNYYFKGDRKKQVWERVQKLLPLLDGEASTLPDLALKFCLSHPSVDTVIPGMRKKRHVEANLRLSDAPRLSDEMIARLKEHRWDKNFYE